VKSACVQFNSKMPFNAVNKGSLLDEINPHPKNRVVTEINAALAFVSLFFIQIHNSKSPKLMQFGASDLFDLEWLCD
ncbi:MAG: hypothetical protein FD128_1013, partial [Hyphomonadaceae bacterium]